MAAGLTISAVPATASLVPTLSSITAVSNGYLFTYDLKLTADQGLSASALDPLSGLRFGSKITIFDFAGYVANSAFVNFNTALDPGGAFTPSTELTTNTSNMATVPGEADDPLVPNLVFTYTGPDFRTTGGGTGATSNFQDVFIAQIGAVSNGNGTNFTSFSGIGVKNTGTTTADTAAFNAGTTLAPASAVPESASWAMMTMGFGVIGSALRTRKKSEVVILG